MLVVNKAVYTCMLFRIFMKLIAIDNEINSIRIKVCEEDEGKLNYPLPFYDSWCIYEADNQQHNENFHQNIKTMGEWVEN